VNFDPILAAKLLGLLGAATAFCWLLAKGLGRRLDASALALGLALPLLLLHPWLDETRLMVPSDPLAQQIPGAPAALASHIHDLLNDAIYCLLPWELEVRHSFAGGHLPLWSDALEGGSSPWVNPQAQPLSPVAMATRVLEIQHHLLAALALKILVAFLGTWLLARVAGVSRFSSLLAAGGFALAGGIMSWSAFPHSTVAAFVPWLAAAAIRLMRGGGFRAVATTGAITAALLLSGQPETAAAGGLFTAVAALSLARRRSFRSGFAKTALAAVLGFCLAAPQLLPFALHLPDSVRFHEVVARTIPDYDLELHPLTWFLPGYGAYMLAPVSPRAYGIPFVSKFRGPFNWAESESGYPGLAAFAFSAVALFAMRRRRLWPFLLFAIASLLLAAQFIPLVHLLHLVSALKTIAWSRFLMVGSLALAVAGGLGLDHLLARRPRQPAAAGAGLAAAAAASLAAHADPVTIGLWLLILLAAAAAFAASKVPAPRRPLVKGVAMALLGLALLADLMPWARKFLPATDPGLFYPRTAFIELIGQEAAAPGGPWRAAGEGQQVFPSLLPVYGIDELRPHNPLTPVQFLRTLDAAFGFAPSTTNYFPAFGNVDHPFLDFLNVRVVASSIGSPPAKTFERIDGDLFFGGLFRVYRNGDALPRYFLPKSAETIEDSDAAVRGFVAALKDPWRVAVFDPRAAAWTGAEGAVESSSPRPGKIVLVVPGEGDRLLATSLRQPRGWHAAGMETLVINGGFLGVHVPAGATRVELDFRPPGLLAGCALAALAALVSIVLALKKLS
jgi:hypothetical protein